MTRRHRPVHRDARLQRGGEPARPLSRDPRRAGADGARTRSSSWTTAATTAAPRSSGRSTRRTRGCGWCGSRPTRARPRPPTPGSATARGRFIVTMDADLQNDPRDIPMLLAHLDQLGRRDGLAGEPRGGRLVGAPGLLPGRQSRAQRAQRRDHPGQRLHIPRLPPRVRAGSRAVQGLSSVHSHAAQDARLPRARGARESPAAALRSVQVRHRQPRVQRLQGPARGAVDEGAAAPLRGGRGRRRGEAPPR